MFWAALYRYALPRELVLLWGFSANSVACGDWLVGLRRLISLLSDWAGTLPCKGPVGVEPRRCDACSRRDSAVISRGRRSAEGVHRVVVVAWRRLA